MEKLVINRYNRSYRAHNLFAEMYEKTPYEAFMVGQDVNFNECVTANQSIFEYAPGSKNITNIQKIAHSLIGVKNGIT